MHTWIQVQTRCSRRTWGSKLGLQHRVREGFREEGALGGLLIRCALQSKQREWHGQRQRDLRETCLIKVCLLWHYWAVKGENEAGGSNQITKDCEGLTKRHVREGVCTGGLKQGTWLPGTYEVKSTYWKPTVRQVLGWELGLQRSALNCNVSRV